MHESTVSRVTTRKFLHTPRGTFEFKYFFSSGVSTVDGGAASATAIQAMIKQADRRRAARAADVGPGARRRAQPARHQRRAPHGREIPRGDEHSFIERPQPARLRMRMRSVPRHSRDHRFFRLRNRSAARGSHGAKPALARRTTGRMPPTSDAFEVRREPGSGAFATCIDRAPTTQYASGASGRSQRGVRHADHDSGSSGRRHPRACTITPRASSSGSRATSTICMSSASCLASRKLLHKAEATMQFVRQEDRPQAACGRDRDRHVRRDRRAGRQDRQAGAQAQGKADRSSPETVRSTRYS